MTFLAPGYLWFLFLLLPLTAIYLLKVRPERRYTPALFLWHQIAEEKQTSALFRKLRDWLSLIMLLLAITSIILAMARPVLSRASSEKNLLLIIDNSASMAAGNIKSSRMEKAKNIASNIINNLNATRQIILATAADKFSVKVNATENLRQLHKGLAEITASDMPLNITSLDFLKDSHNFLSDSRALLISDGCFKDVKKLAGVELVKVDYPLLNCGITAFDFVRLPGKNHQLGVYFQLASSYKKTIETDLIISSNTPDNIIKVCPVTIHPGLNKPETYIIDNAPDGKWFAKLDIKDALDKDNIVPAFVSRPNPVRIMIAGERELPFFAMCIKAFRNGNTMMNLVDKKSAAVLVSGNIPPESSADKFIVFNPSGQSPFWHINKKDHNSGISQTIMPEHPAIKFCRIDGLSFTGIKNISPPDGSIILCRTLDNVPLIYKTSYAGQSAFILNFDPLKSDFFLNINFPIMINAMIFELTGKSEEKRTIYYTGERIVQTKPRPAGKIEFSPPETPKLTLELPLTENIMQYTGFYSLPGEKGNTFYAAGLLNPADSLLDNTKVKSTAKPIESGTPLAKYLLILGLLIIAAESMLYHRGKVG